MNGHWNSLGRTYGYVTPKFVILTAISCWFLLFFCCPIFFHFVSLLCVLHYWSVFHFSFQFVNCCPRRDFAQKAKSRGGNLVTRAYIKESTYSWIYSYTVNTEKRSICLNRGREESVGNDDVSIACARKYEMVSDVKHKKLTTGKFCGINCVVVLRYSFALPVISDILWSSFYESYGPKDTR